MKLYWGDEVNGWRIWGIRFGRNRYLTVAFSINDWERAQLPSHPGGDGEVTQVNFEPRPLRRSPTVAEMAGAFEGQGPDAVEWLREQRDRDLPSVAEMYGSMPGFTGGVDSTEYVRRVRGTSAEDEKQP